MSTKISNLPPYYGTNNQIGDIPISINGVTYKINPGSLVPSLQSYKVFTALLTQYGGSSLVDFGSGSLTIGTTYKIIQQSSPATGYDFTNVGAPDNNLGTTFIATGTTPNSWGNNNVGLRYDEGAPVVTVLENTIGNVFFIYDSTGVYSLKSSGLFTNNKTVCPLDQTINWNSNSNNSYSLSINNISNSIIEITILRGVTPYTNIDSMLSNKLIEIRVYN
jgi:hypothetical protein